MSLILEALRKSEAERRRGQSPELFAAMPVSGGPHRSARPQQAWPWLLVLLLVAASITGWYRYTHKAPPATIEKHSDIAKAPAKNPSSAPATKDVPADLTGMDHTAMQYVPESRPAQTEGAAAMVADAAGSTPNALASLFPRQLETKMPTSPVASSGPSSTASAPSTASPGSPPPAPMTSAPAPAAASAAPPASIPGATSASTPATAHTPTTAPASTPAATQAPTTPASVYATTATPAPATTPTPAKTLATAPAPTRMPAPAAATAMTPAPAQALPTPRPAPPSPPLPSKTEPKAATPAVARADATPRQTTDNDLPSLAMLGPKERSELPPYKLSMHVWASEPGKRFAIIDGKRVTEGSMATGSVVEEIRRDGVVLNLRGRRYLLPRP